MTIKVVSIASRMNLGGVAVLLSDLHKSLSAPDFSHTLITGKCAENEIDILAGKPHDSNIIYVNSMGRSLSLVGDISTFFTLRKILKNISPDVVHTHTSKAGVVGRIAALTLRKKPAIVHTFHGHHLYGYFSKVVVRIMVTIEKVLAFKTNLLVADSLQVQIDLQQHGVGSKNNWKVIAPGIRDMQFIEKASARKKLGINENRLVISWVGRFTDIKNPILAVETFQNLPLEIREKAQLIMIGDGELFDQCKDYSITHGLNVLYTGWESDVGPYLAASDLLLMTSKNEGFGMVIAEAGFFAVPTVSTDVGGVKEFIQNGVNGILAEANPRQLSDAISEMATKPERIKSLGLEAKKTTLRRFTAEIFVAGHKEAYKELMR